ncbi:MAG TPA: hypothetical protein VEA41_10155 [Salinarimonas sp.]|nr:hypothetical protein [Salinarimonas sp.]
MEVKIEIVEQTTKKTIRCGAVLVEASIAWEGGRERVGSLRWVAIGEMLREDVDADEGLGHEEMLMIAAAYQTVLGMHGEYVATCLSHGLYPIVEGCAKCSKQEPLPLDARPGAV